MLAAVMPWLFLVVATGGALLTVNALTPIRRSTWLFIPSFLFSMFAAELAAYHLAWQLAAGATFVALGALQGWPGYVALVLASASWLGLLYLVVAGRRAVSVVRESLAPLLGDEAQHEPIVWRRLLLPFPLRLARTRVVRNIVYAKVAGQRLRLDVYRPTEARGPRPAVMQIHGGAWVVGDKREQGIPLMTRLSDRGFVGFNVNYRLSPGATFPDHLIDLKRALVWIREHAAEYDVDPTFIAVTGGSAGGHLAAMMALTSADATFQPGFEAADTSVQAAVPFYGLYDLTNAHGSHHPALERRVLEPHVIKAFRHDEPEKFARASPIHWIGPDAPPFFVIHGDRDTMAPLADAAAFATALRKVSRQPVAFAKIPGGQHSFDVFLSPRSLPVIEAVGDFLAHLYAERRGLRAEHPGKPEPIAVLASPSPASPDAARSASFTP